MPDTLLADLPDFADERAAFLEGRRKPSDLLEACIANIEAYEPRVRAFVCLDIAGARRQAAAADARYREGRPLSPIDGMPIAIKDIIDTADMPTELNSPWFAGHQPRVDAASVAAARQGGAVILGKSVTTEFALGRPGPTVNPHDPAHTPGGSSSGAAAGAASGMFPAGFATQTQGSILRPASFNGMVGFKPTLGALATEGIHPVSRTHDTLGAIGQSVQTVWTLARWLGERAPGQGGPGLGGAVEAALVPAVPQRLAVARVKGMSEMDAASLDAFDACLEALRARGVTIVEPDADPYLAAVVAGLDRVPEMSVQMVAHDMRWPFAGYVAAAPDQIGPRLHEWVELGQTVTLDAYRLLLAERAALRAQVADLGRSYDAVVLPAASGPAPQGLESTGSRTLLQYWTFLGFPAWSLPLMRVGAMPLGLQLAGFGGADHQLARIARWIAG